MILSSGRPSLGLVERREQTPQTVQERMTATRVPSSSHSMPAGSRATSPSLLFRATRSTAGVQPPSVVGLALPIIAHSPPGALEAEEMVEGEVDLLAGPRYAQREGAPDRVR
jgi:hypothetical protein